MGTGFAEMRLHITLCFPIWGESQGESHAPPCATPVVIIDKSATGLSYPCLPGRMKGNKIAFIGEAHTLGDPRG